MNTKINKKLRGYIGIAPTGNLKQTAEGLGEALKDIEFYEDDSGRFDEFPAFCATAFDCELILLGIPSEENYLGDEPLDYFQLQIKNNGSSEIASHLELSKYFVEQIQKNSKLRCWALD